LLVSELAGRSTVVLKGRELGLDLESDRSAADRVLERVKELEHIGYTFEAADASFELLVRAETGLLREHFRLESYRTIVERRDDGTVVAEATVKVWVDDERFIGTGEGNGPVDALDHAFRAALTERLPAIARMHLRDYKVRILDANAGTGATTRVLIRSTDGERDWDTVGVSSNVIEASWVAMEDAYATAFRVAGELAAPA
jgi:2-isopropylmalate synthase